MAKLDITTMIVTMAILFIGAMFGGMFIPWINISLDPWVHGIVIAIIQGLLLAIFGIVTGKLQLSVVFILGSVIFVGGLIGGFVAGWIGFGNIYATVVILAIQTMILTLTGFIGRGKTPIATPKL